MRYRGRAAGTAAVLGKGIAELLGRPCGRGMLGDGDVDDPSPVVREDDEHEQQPVGDGWHDEEIGRHDLADMAGQERSPWLGWWRVSSRHVLRDGRLTHRDSQFLPFPMNPRRTPEWIRGGHATNQRADLGTRGWATGTIPTLPRPEQAKPASVPGEYGVRFDEDERRPPTAPHLRQPCPEHPIRRGQTKVRGRERVRTAT